MLAIIFDRTSLDLCFSQRLQRVGNHLKLDHIHVIITYGATCLNKTAANSVELAVFETPTLPKMHQ